MPNQNFFDLKLKFLSNLVSGLWIYCVIDPLNFSSMPFKSDTLEYDYNMPKWHFWVLILVGLPLPIAGFFVEIKDPFGKTITPYLSVMILVVLLVYLPIKTRNYFVRNQKIVLEKDRIRVPTDFRGLLSVDYVAINKVDLVYRNTVPLAAKITFNRRKTVRVLIDYFENDVCFTKFLDELNHHINGASMG